MQKMDKHLQVVVVKEVFANLSPEDGVGEEV
jgi:hypothetical protein